MTAIKCQGKAPCCSTSHPENPMEMLSPVLSPMEDNGPSPCCCGLSSYWSSIRMLLNAPDRQGLLPTGKARIGAHGVWYSGLSIMQGKKCRKGVRKDDRKRTWQQQKKHPPLGLQLAFEGSWSDAETRALLHCGMVVWHCAQQESQEAGSQQERGRRSQGCWSSLRTPREQFGALFLALYVPRHRAPCQLRG